MAKLKTKNIKKNKVGGYGLSSPWSTAPGTQDDTRGIPQAGVGNYFGSGVRNPVGKIRDAAGSKPISRSKLSQPPKKLA